MTAAWVSFTRTVLQNGCVWNVDSSFCWCQYCRRQKLFGTWGTTGWERFVHHGTTCCKQAWLSRGWFCRWCGRDGDSGNFEAAHGIYGERNCSFLFKPSYCECGWQLAGWKNFNFSSCGPCWAVCTQQLVRYFIKLFGHWMEIHDLIWKFLIVCPAWGCVSDLENAACSWMLGQIRDFGRHYEGLPPCCKRHLKLDIPSDESSTDRDASSSDENIGDFTD